LAYNRGLIGGINHDMIYAPCFPQALSIIRQIEELRSEVEKCENTERKTVRESCRESLSV